MKTPSPHRPNDCRSKFFHLLPVALAVPMATAPLHADGPPPVLDFTTGLPGKQVRLSWQAEPRARYRVEKSPDLSPGSWKPLALVEAMGPFAEWLDPQAVSSRSFYRVSAPQPEVFSIEPTVLATTGGTLWVYGQSLPAEAYVELVDGTGAVVATVPLIEEIAGRWRADFSGPFAPGEELSARIVAPGGSQIGMTVPVGVTISGLATDAPAGLPPAAPQPLGASKPVPGIGVIVKKGPFGDQKRLAGRGDEECDDADPGILPLGMAINEKPQPPLVKRPRKGNQSSHRISPPSSGLPGEVSFRFEALSLPCPAGPPLEWVMTYRSSRPVSSGHGPQWDFSYNISIEPQPAGSGSGAPRIVVRDGGGRADVFHRQTDGSYRCDGLYREGRFTGDTFTLTFADQGKWIFKPLDGSPAAGKIASITDRNGVSLTCSYDASGLLATVSDVFGRSLSVTWDSATGVARISSVADNFGRGVHFSAYAAGESGGAEGTLKSISCAQLAGMPAEAAPFVFTYTTGQPDPDLNDNLLSITDGEGRLLEAFTYHPTTDPRSVEYDRCATHSRQGGPYVTHLQLVRNSSPDYTIYQVDELGRLTETDCDMLHRVTAIRQFTGFCTPGTPADATTNRPAGKLRASDPDFFETQYSWNPDHALTRVTDPDGSQLRFVHEREMKPGCPVIERGNVRTATLRSGSGQTRTVSFDYLPGFGTLESARPGNPIRGMTVKGGRNPGGDIIAQGRASSGDWVDQDCDGYSSARHKYKGWNGTVKGVGIDDDCDGISLFSRKILDRGEAGDNVGLLLRGIEKKDIKRGMVIVKPSLVWSPRSNFSGGDDDCDGLIVPVAMDKGLRFRSAQSKDEGGRHTPFHNKYRPQFYARGITINTSHVEYRSVAPDGPSPAFTVAKQSQGVDFGQRQGGGNETDIDCGGPSSVMELISGSSYKLKAGFLYSAEPITPRISRVVTGHGQEITWTYDAHGNPSSCATPIAGGGAGFQYDTLGRCTSVSLADGAGSFVTEFSYDAATGMPSSVTQDPGGLAITTQYDYDPLGRCTREVDAAGFDTLYEYLPSGRLARCESPPVGSTRIATTFHYDQACRLVRCDVENRNADGTLHSSNSDYSTFFVYDSRGRLTRIAEEERPVNVTGELTPDSLGIENFAVCDFTINPAGEITRVSTPGACRGSTEDLVCDYQFDERGLLYRCIQGVLGSASSIVDQFDYSIAGLPVRTARLVGGAAVSEMVCDYDGFHRLSSVTDPMGNVVQFSYDSRGGVTTEVYGQAINEPGSTGNVLLSRSTMVSSNQFGNGAGGDITRLTLPDVGDVCYDLEITNTPSSASRSLFHAWETRDDTITEERFTAGSSAPPVLETTVITRSPAGLLKQVSRNGDLLATFTHDSAGRSLTCSNGACSVSVTRDHRGNVHVCGETQHFRVGGLPPKTFTTTLQYDSLGRMVSCSDSSGNTATQSFDSLGRVQTMVTALACTITCDYDGSSTAGAYSQRASADLDGDGAPDIVVASLHRCGEWKSSNDPLGHVTTATHDALGRLSRVDYPEGTYETFSYNARGLHHQGRLLDGTTRNIEHDLNGRAVSVSLSGSPAGVAPVPDTVYQYDGLGRTVSCVQGTSQVSFAWDSLGNRIGETQGDVTVSSSYSHRGRAAYSTSVQYPYELNVSENRDSLGRVLSVSLLDGSGSPLPPVASFEHLGLHLSRIVSGNGVSSAYTYRGDGDAPVPGDHTFGMSPVRCVVTNSSGTVLSDGSISRNAGQLATSISTRFSDDPAVPGRLLSLTHDSLGRVTAWTTTREGEGLPPVVENEVSYTLDARGDRLLATGGPYPGSYTQSTTDAQRGRYTTWPQGTLEWDPNRNLTRIPYGDVTHTMQYDALGRIVAVNNDSTGSPVAEFTYDALNRLVTLVVHSDGLPPSYTRFIYDGSVCIQELGNDGVADLTYVVSGGMRHCISTRNGTIYYPHGGGIGGYVAPCDASSEAGYIGTCDAALLAGATGAVVEHSDCDGDGRPVFLSPDGTPSSTGRSVTPIRWMAPESLWLPETRLHHVPGGTYSPNLGMFTSKDKGKGTTVTHSKELKGHVTLIK